MKDQNTYTSAGGKIKWYSCFGKHEPAIPPPGINPREVKIHKQIYTQVFPTALFIITKDWKQPKSPSTNEWIISPNVYIHKKDCYSIIKNEVPPNRITENWVNWKLVLNVKQKAPTMLGHSQYLYVKICMYMAKINAYIDKETCLMGAKIQKNQTKTNGVLIQVILWMNFENIMVGERNQ